MKYCSGEGYAKGLMGRVHLKSALPNPGFYPEILGFFGSWDFFFFFILKSQSRDFFWIFEKRKFEV